MHTVPYISAVGSLIYLAIATCPDIAYSVGVLARFNTNPGKLHWAAVKHLFRYLRGTLDVKLTYAPDPPTPEQFVTYSDADHGGCKDTGYSTGAHVIKMGTGAVSWRSKLQGIVTNSTCVAEYIAAVSAGEELLSMRNLFLELGYDFSAPHTLCIDNQLMISVTQKPTHHGKMKYLDLKYFWIKDAVAKQKTIQTVYCPTDFMVADILTKALTVPKVKVGCKLLGLTSFGGSDDVQQPG